MDSSVWSIVSACANAVSTLILLGTAYILVDQLESLRKATHAQAFLGAAERLQNEELRETRGRVFKLAGKDAKLWTAGEIADVEKVCHSYDVVGIMAKHKILPKILIVDSWGDSIRRLWPICEPLVIKYRAQRKAPEFWDDFEWLAVEANKFQKKQKHPTRTMPSPSAG